MTFAELQIVDQLGPAKKTVPAIKDMNGSNINRCCASHEQLSNVHRSTLFFTLYKGGPGWRIVPRTGEGVCSWVKMTFCCFGKDREVHGPQRTNNRGVMLWTSFFQYLSQTSSDLFRDFGNPSKHGFGNTYLVVSLISRGTTTIFIFLNFSLLSFRFLIPKHLSNFFGYQHFRLYICTFNNPDLLRLSQFLRCFSLNPHLLCL
ncbi:hypothetical protein LXL04_003113 [Taraxacum kok-saghyz]